jgi:hypothetical protein
LVWDLPTASFNDAAADRLVAGGEAAVRFVSHPIDTTIAAHEEMADKILEHEQKGEYVSSGETAAAQAQTDYLVASAAYGVTTSAFRALSPGPILRLNLTAAQIAADEAAAAARIAADAGQAAGRTSGAGAGLAVGENVFGDVSTGGAPRTLNPKVQQVLDDMPLEKRSPATMHGECAEPGCVGQALDAGVDPRGGTSSAARIRAAGHARHGTWMAPCPSCQAMLEYFGINW